MQLSTQLKVNRRSLTAYLLGEHGDSSMIPWSHVTVAGKPIDELLAEKPELYHMDAKEVILDKVHKEGYIENTTKAALNSASPRRQQSWSARFTIMNTRSSLLRLP